jgi:hypothetical protein
MSNQATIPSARRLMIAAPLAELRAGHGTSSPLESAAPGQSVSRIATHHAIAPATIRPMVQTRIGLKRI